MRIIVDMDEVLAEFVQKVLNRWNAINGTHFTKGDITEWRMENVLGRDVTGRLADGLIDEWLGEDGFYLDLEPIPDSIKSLQYLMDHGHDIVIATSIPEVAVHAFDDKRAWMRRYFPKFSMKSFMASSRKGLIQGDILIDDGSHNITDWCLQGKTGALVMDNPWNEHLKETVHGVPVTRVFDWYHIMNVIEEIAKERHQSRMRTLHGIIQ